VDEPLAISDASQVTVINKMAGGNADNYAIEKDKRRH
jgi:hypothetical protein